MDIRDLKCFIRIYEMKSFSRASQNLYLTQQALSKMIKNLEEEIGIKLFIREKHGVKPTPTGDLLYEKSVPLIGEFDKIPIDLQNSYNLAQGTVKVGMHKGLDVLYYSDILFGFNRKYPNIHIDITTMPGKESEWTVYEDVVDFATVILPVNERKFVFQKMFEDELVALVHRDNPLSRQSALRYKDLAGENILLPDETNKYHDLVVGAFREQGVDPRVIPCNAYVNFMINLVVNREGVAVLSTANLRWQDLREVVVPVRLVPATKRINGFIHKRGKKLTYVATLFRDFMADKVEFPPAGAKQVS